MPKACPPAICYLHVTSALVLSATLTACSLADPLLRETHRSDSSLYLSNSTNPRTPFVADAAPSQLETAKPETQIKVIPASADVAAIVNPDTRIYIQIAAFSNKQNASRYRDELAKQQPHPVVVFHDKTTDKVMHKVQIGPFTTLAAADKAERQIRQQMTVDTVSYVRR